jgi:hypothetical protein
MFYKLVGKQVVQATIEEALEINEIATRLKFTVFSDHGVTVSTIFLCSSPSTGGNPRCFETMVSGGSFDCDIQKFADFDAAIDGHEKACELVAKRLAAEMKNQTREDDKDPSP